MATNQDLEALKGSGDFRANLFFRLRTHHVHVPPLRERLDDLPILLDHFLTQASRQLGKRRPTPPRELVDLLATYDFPGNVREPQAMVFDAVSRHGSRKLSMAAFEAHISTAVASSDALTVHDPDASTIDFPGRLPSMVEIGDLLIREALTRANQNQTAAARALGMSRTTLSKRLKRLSACPPPPQPAANQRPSH